MRKTDAWRTRGGAWMAAALAAMLVAGCGGGGGASSASTGSNASAGSTAAILEPGSPAATGDTATDGYNWFNFRRKQMGLAQLTRNTLIDKAALNHSNYQQQNGLLSHQEVATNPGFTGVDIASRLRAAGYTFNTTNSYAYGEVISKTGDASGFNSAEALITAIYHRFVVFDPKFQLAGAGSARAADGYIYFTTDFTAPNLATGGLGKGRFLPYPFPGQTNIATIFYSDQEEPDPVPDRNEVGYPVSVHADTTSTIAVQSFSITPRGGAPLATRLLSSATDAQTGASTAAIIPLSVLSAQTTYDVQFSGTVDGVPASLAWSFTTR